MTVAVAVAAAKTSTGNQDITTADLSGATPKAVLFLYSRAASNGTIATDAGVSFGAADATSQVAFASWAKHAATSSSAAIAKVGKSDKCICALASSTAIHSEAAFVSFIVNGVRVDWTTATADGWLVTAIFFEGSDWDVQVGNILIPVAPGTTVSTTWQPDCVFMMGVSDNMSGTIVTARTQSSFGMTTWPDGSTPAAAGQASWNWGITRQNALVNSVQWGAYHFETSGQYGINVTRSSSSFIATAQSGASTGTHKWGYLALHYSGTGQLKAGTISLDDVTGNQAFTGFGGATGGFLILLPAQQVAGVGGQFDWRFGMSLHTTTKSGGFAIGSTSDSNTVSTPFPTVHHSVACEDTITMLGQDGTTNLVCTFSSFDSNGITLNFTNAPDFDPGRGAGFVGMDWPYLTIINFSGAVGGSSVQAWIID